MRDLTWVLFEEVRAGSWAIGGKVPQAPDLTPPTPSSLEGLVPPGQGCADLVGAVLLNVVEA